MKKVLCLLLLLSLCVTGGCRIREVNETTVTTALGADWDGEQMVITSQLARPGQNQPAGEGGGGQASTLVISERGLTATDATRSLSLSIPRIPLWSHAGLVVLGEGLAHKDLSLIADLLSRNVDIRKNALLVVCHRVTPEELLQVETPLEPYSGMGLQKMLRIQERQLGIYVPTTLHDFLAALSTPGIDPLASQVTVIKKGDQKLVQLSGMAVFHGRRQVGSLNERQSRGYRWMQPRLIQGGLFSIPFPEQPEKSVALELIRSRAQIKPEISSTGIKMRIKINAEGNFYEQTGMGELLTPEKFGQLERLAEKEIEGQCRDCIGQAQDLGSDIFGWGRMVESTDPRAWQEFAADWARIFPGVESEVQVKFALRRTYLTDKSFQFKE